MVLERGERGRGERRGGVVQGRSTFMSTSQAEDTWPLRSSLQTQPRSTFFVCFTYSPLSEEASALNPEAAVEACEVEIGGWKKRIIHFGI